MPVEEARCSCAGSVGSGSGRRETEILPNAHAPDRGDFRRHAQPRCVDGALAVHQYLARIMIGMSDIDAIRRAARERAKQMGLSYEGALLPAEAYALMQAGAKLVDVRTRPEMHYVGRVPGSLPIEWQTWPDSRPNPEFLRELADAVDKDEPVMFLCRSGARSHSAAEAATREGWKTAYNILEGFEGPKDADGHRNTVAGWRKSGLPWIQS